MITEELLAAFEEGKTNAEETAMILHELSIDEDLQEEYILSQKLDAMMGLEDEDLNILPMQAMAAESEGNLCDFNCELYILKRRNRTFNANELSDEAKSNRWLQDRGTPLHCVGRLLEQNDLIVMRQYGAVIDDIKRAINAKHDVIVVINNNKLNDIDNDSVSYHAVVVTKVTEHKVELYNPALGNELESYSISNFEAAWKDAKSYMARVKGKDFDYNPRPIDLDDVDLTTDLIDLREAIAENAHEIWADKRQEEGWTYGKERNDTKKENPDMVPYSMLPDSEKEYDRHMALDTIKLMKKLGFEIVKHNDTKVHAELMRKINHEDDARICDCGGIIFIDQQYCPHCGKKINWKEFL